MPVAIQHISEYEKLRAKNIEENKKMLESLGLLRSFKPILEPIKKRKALKIKKIPPPIKRKFEETKQKNATALEEVIGNRIRRSLRVKGVEPDGSIISPPEEDTPSPRRPTSRVNRENTFGPIEGIAVGTHWESRLGCSNDAVHRPTVAGIHGNTHVGCYSIALSGGYEDDIDLGDSFTYTGSGGRDLRGTASQPKNLRTAAQSSDQTLSKHNLALSLNVDNRQPVRVIRGYKCPSAFAPEYGYRYDGLYSVEKCWSAIGLSGFVVYKYILKRIPGQEPPPWKEALSDIQEHLEDSKLDATGENLDEKVSYKENVDPNNNEVIPTDEKKDEAESIEDDDGDDEDNDDNDDDSE